MRIDKRGIIEKMAVRTIKTYGSDAEENRVPGSKANSQAEYIANFISQLDDLELIINNAEQDGRLRDLHSLNIVWE